LRNYLITRDVYYSPLTIHNLVIILGSVKSKLVAALFVLLSFPAISAQERPSIPATDRVRLAEAFRLGNAVGNSIWPGWTRAPFAVLLVTPEHEFLVRHPAPSADFTTLGYDSLLKSDVYYRRRTQSISFLATFPAIKGSIVSTIVVGQAENTSARTSTPWVVTLLHEHFHQLQYSQPSYYQDVNALGLAHGDQTGMWMLSYAFPYDRKDVQDQFALLSELLAKAIQARRSDRAKTLVAYLDARRKFQQMLAPDDYRYFSFQLWQEGIARYTEYAVANVAAGKFRPGKAFRALKDYTSLAEVAQQTRERIFRQLITQKLAESKREVVYPFGAAEGLLLDKVNPRWKGRYLVDKFDLGKLFPMRKSR
jgi:hypothetical protein